MPPVTNMVQHLEKVLVANRGEIAVRCIRACKDLSITSVTIFTPADANSLHVRLSDESVLLEDEGPGAYTDMYVLMYIIYKSIQGEEGTGEIKGEANSVRAATRSSTSARNMLSMPSSPAMVSSARTPSFPAASRRPVWYSLAPMPTPSMPWD